MHVYNVSPSMKQQETELRYHTLGGVNENIKSKFCISDVGLCIFSDYVKPTTNFRQVDVAMGLNLTTSFVFIDCKLKYLKVQHFQFLILLVMTGSAVFIRLFRYVGMVIMEAYL